MNLDGVALVRDEGQLGEWECMECGYIVAGMQTQQLAACPDCGAPRQALEFFPYEDGEIEAGREGEAPDEIGSRVTDADQLDPEEDRPTR